MFHVCGWECIILTHVSFFPTAESFRSLPRKALGWFGVPGGSGAVGGYHLSLFFGFFCCWGGERVRLKF